MTTRELLINASKKTGLKVNYLKIFYLADWKKERKIITKSEGASLIYSEKQLESFIDYILKRKK